MHHAAMHTLDVSAGGIKRLPSDILHRWCWQCLYTFLLLFHSEQTTEADTANRQWRPIQETDGRGRYRKQTVEADTYTASFPSFSHALSSQIFLRFLFLLVFPFQRKTKRYVV